jgi:hypothetical protein
VERSAPLSRSEARATGVTGQPPHRRGRIARGCGRGKAGPGGPAFRPGEGPCFLSNRERQRAIRCASTHKSRLVRGGFRNRFENVLNKSTNSYYYLEKHCSRSCFLSRARYLPSEDGGPFYFIEAAFSSLFLTVISRGAVLPQKVFVAECVGQGCRIGVDRERDECHVGDFLHHHRQVCRFAW